MISSPSSKTQSTEQKQFLTILSREEAMARFEEALGSWQVSTQRRSLADALGMVLAEDVAVPVDVPPFDRSNVDGFAVRAADLTTASELHPARLMLNQETIACGTVPQVAVVPGTATPIATGGPLPRGADAVVMIEHSQPAENGAVEMFRPASPGQFISSAGSDMARGEVVLRAGSIIGAREIGMLAACGTAHVTVACKLRVAVVSTGDELVQPGEPLRPAGIYDANGAIISAAVIENGGEVSFLGAFADDEEKLEAAMRDALASHDVLIMSGGTSKGAGDISYRIIERLGSPGIIAHGVALKPGKPLCLAICNGKPVIILPGFPTSAMFTFHDMIVPVLRRLARLPPRIDAQTSAQLPFRIASELGRTEYVMVSLVQARDGLAAYASGKGSGAITAFTQADGFIRIDALADHLPAGEHVQVTLFTPQVRVPDLVVIGCHCTGLDLVVSKIVQKGICVRSLAVGSLGGLAAARRGECDLAPTHLLDAQTGVYNRPFLGEGMKLVPGWRRMQGIVFRSGDMRFEGRSAAEVMKAVLADPECMIVNRNQGSGTRILIDGLLGQVRPDGYWNQPRSHTAVAAAVEQRRADWGVTIAPVARAAGLGFIPLTEEHYDFVVVAERQEREPVQAFLEALSSSDMQDALEQAGFSRAS